jgi:hypothetical protein
MIALLDENAVLEAAHSCYALALADEYENLGGRLSQVELHSWAQKLPAEEQLPIVYYYLGKIAQAWGYDVGLVFYHAGIVTPEQQECALRHLLLGCMGHGVSLADDHSKAIARAEAVLGRTFKLSPIYFEGVEWMELAMEAAAGLLEVAQ